MRFYFEHQKVEERARVVTSCTILVGSIAFLVCDSGLKYLSTDLYPADLAPATGYVERGG